MKRQRILGAVLLGLLLPMRAQALQVSSGAACCLGTVDFGQELQGAFLVEVPDNGKCFLSQRQLRPGDTLTKEQLEELTFVPDDTRWDAAAALRYLPVGKEVGSLQTLRFTIRGKENLPPEAEDSSLETYQNLENTGKLLARDPEGETLTYTVTRQPRRGTVAVSSDGSFTYTPKNNKVGVDSFAYTAADPQGKTSREATVTITILRPTEPEPYADTQGTSCCFSAQWMRASGIFSGELLGDARCFQPEKRVNKGEFLTMVVKTLSIPVEDQGEPRELSSLPKWLRPYAAAALRAGLTEKGVWKTGWSSEEDLTGQEAAALLCGALDLDGAAETWLPLLEEQGIELTGGTVTRAQAANAMYRLRKLTEESVGKLK